MKHLGLLLFLLTSFTLPAQDKVYFLDGSKLTCTVVNIMSEHIELVNGQGNTSIVSKFDLLLIEYHNGKFEIFNRATKDLETNESEEENDKKKVETSQFKQNYLSINTLALTNADISAFYEYVSPNKKGGFGVMGAYNFNTRTTFQNVFFINLPNSRKLYDVGVFCKAYLNSSSEKNIKFSLGLFFKYTNFTFDIVKIDSVSGPAGSTQILTYSHSGGMQLASMGTLDCRVNLNDSFFITGLVGLGGFNLRGVYKQEFNKEINKNLKPGEQVVNYSFLPKIYFGLNAGFNF